MAAIACSSAASAAFLPPRSAPSPGRSTPSSSKSKASFWSRRKSSSATSISISSPVLISRSDQGRRCLPVSQAAQMARPTVTTTTPIKPCVGQLVSPLRMNPITSRMSYASAESAPVRPADGVSAVGLSAASAPPGLTTFAEAAEYRAGCEIADFVFPSPPLPPAPRSVVSSVPSSRFSVWSNLAGSDFDSDCEEDDDVDELTQSCVMAEPRFDDVTPVASPITHDGAVDIEAELRAMTVAARSATESSKLMGRSDVDGGLARHARMAIYIPSTSEREFFDDESIDDDVAAGLVFYPAVPASRSAAAAAMSYDESDIEDLLAAYL